MHTLYIDPMTQIPEAEANQQQNFDAQQEAGISIADMIDFLRAHFVQLFAIAVTTGMISLGTGYFVRMAAGTTKLATAPVIQQASAPATMARRPSAAKSLRRFGAIALRPPI